MPKEVDSMGCIAEKNNQMLYLEKLEKSKRINHLIKLVLNKEGAKRFHTVAKAIDY